MCLWRRLVARRLLALGSQTRSFANIRESPYIPGNPVVVGNDVHDLRFDHAGKPDDPTPPTMVQTVQSLPSSEQVKELSKNHLAATKINKDQIGRTVTLSRDVSTTTQSGGAPRKWVLEFNTSVAG